MSMVWMTGWELGTEGQSFSNSGWLVGSNASLVGPNASFNFHHPNALQPAGGFGGGRYSLAIGAGNNNDSIALGTPASGPGSIGAHPELIFHAAYKREGSTGSLGWIGGEFLGFYSGSQVLLRLIQTGSNITVSSMTLYAWSGSVLVFQGTTTTTYTGSQPYHRIVFDIDGSAGDYDMYVNGVLEISVSGSSETFATIDGVRFRSGCTTGIGTGGTGTGGGRWDHCVMWDAGNHSTGDCVIANQPVDTEVVVVGGKTYTFQASLTAGDGNVFRGADGAAARENLTNAINLGPGAGTLYAVAMTLNSVVTAQEDLAATAVHVIAKSKGTETGATTDTLTGGGDGWVAANLAGGDLDKTNDLALALGDIYIQGFLPNADSVDGSFLNVNGVNDGTNTDMFGNIDDGQNLTDFIETVTSPDAVEFDHESRADIDAGWAPSAVHAVQSTQILRASGAISGGRTTLDIPSLGKITSDVVPLGAAGILVPILREWRTANITTDVDGVKSGTEV